MVEQAFRSFTALPGPADKDWWVVLKCFRYATLTEIEAAYRSLIKDAHPDHGGSHEAMAELNAARDKARKAQQQESGP